MDYLFLVNESKNFLDKLGISIRGKTQRLGYDVASPLAVQYANDIATLIDSVVPDKTFLYNTISNEIAHNVFRYLSSTKDWEGNDENDLRGSLIMNLGGIADFTISAFHPYPTFTMPDASSYLGTRMALTNPIYVYSYWIFRNGDPQTGYNDELTAKLYSLVTPVLDRYNSKIKNPEQYGGSSGTNATGTPTGRGGSQPTGGNGNNNSYFIPDNGTGGNNTGFQFAGLNGNMIQIILILGVIITIIFTNRK